MSVRIALRILYNSMFILMATYLGITALQCVDLQFIIALNIALDFYIWETIRLAH